MVKYFNSKLCKRFVDDKGLPIPPINDAEIFDYYLDLYEPEFGARTLYNEVCKEITDKFGGDPDKFLEDYYAVRNKIIEDILAKPQYQDLLKWDMESYPVMEELGRIPHGNVYSPNNVGKWFISIDIKQANFYSMKFFNPEIVNNKETYEDFVKDYTDSEYFITSRYTRQRIFGKCKGVRQMIIERHMMSKFYKEFYYDHHLIELVKFNNDEIILEIKDFENFAEEDKIKMVRYVRECVDAASKLCGVGVSCKIFCLESMCLHSERTGKDRHMWYCLNNHVEDICYGFKDVPQNYHALVYKLLNCMELNQKDYYFRYEGLSAFIDDEFSIKVFSDAKTAIDNCMKVRREDNENNVE